MKQVMVREKELHGGHNRLLPADVVSQKGDMLCVRIKGRLKNSNVKMSDVIPMGHVTGGQPMVNLNRPISLIHQAPLALHSLGAKVRG